MKTQTFELITSSETNEWYTPPWLITIAREFYDGEIDLDPASCELAQSWIKAKKYYTKEQNGFGHKWIGRIWLGKVWLNPPYGSKSQTNYGTNVWCSLAAQYFTNCKAGLEILLLVGGTSQGKKECQRLGLTLSFEKRIKFIDHTGLIQKSPPPAPDLIYLGHRNARFVECFGHLGLISQIIN